MQEIDPDYRLLMQALREVGTRMKAVWNKIAGAIGPAVSVITDALSNIGFVSTKPTHSRLRLSRHRTQHERRIAWKIAHPFEPIHINNRLMAQRKMRLA